MAVLRSLPVSFAGCLSLCLVWFCFPCFTKSHLSMCPPSTGKDQIVLLPIARGPHQRYYHSSSRDFNGLFGRISKQPFSWETRGGMRGDHGYLSFRQFECVRESRQFESFCSTRKINNNKSLRCHEIYTICSLHIMEPRVIPPSAIARAHKPVRLPRKHVDIIASVAIYIKRKSRPKEILCTIPTNIRVHTHGHQEHKTHAQSHASPIFPNTP